jgi:iron complex outermembrane receptor protein
MARIETKLPMNLMPTVSPPHRSSRPLLLRLVTAVLLLSPFCLSAQTPGTGEVGGRVSNKALGLFLEGARVELVGANRAVLTDRDGRFRLADVPAGTATLAVSYTGLNLQRVVVDVSAAQVVTRDIDLVSDVYVMDAFTVASIREGQAAAITQQRNAPNVKSVVANDAFGNIADGNAAEVLKLLPGISAINDENEARYLMVRGIDANLNNVTFDGMKLASGGQGANRQTGISEIPLGAIEIMEVTKSPTPDMDGDSIGGNINMRPASIFDRAEPRRITYALSASGRTVGEHVRATAYTSNRIRPTIALGYANVFGKNRNIGVALNLSHTVNWVAAGGNLLASWQPTRESPAYMRSLAVYDFHSTDRMRSGANLRLDYKVSDHSLLYVNSFYTYYDNKNQFEGGNQNVSALRAQVATLDASGRPIPAQVQFPFGHPSYRPGGFNAAGARVEASILPGYTDRVTELVNSTYSFAKTPVNRVTKRYSFQPGGRHRYGQLEIDYAGIYEESPAWESGMVRDPNAVRGYTVTVANTSWRLDGTKTGSAGRRELTQTGGVNVRDPANWVLGGMTTQGLDQGTDLFGGQLNVKLSFAKPIPAYIKTGFKYMSEERYTSNPNKTYVYSGPQGAFLGNFIDTSLPTSIPAGKWHPFGFLPGYLDLAKINQYREANPQFFTANAATSLQNALTNDKNAREQVFAGYAMGNMSLGALSVLGGLRVERTYASGESAVQDPRAGLTLTDPVARTQAQWGKRTSVERDYTNVLPGLHFKYEAGKNWLMRASYSQSFGRPSFGSIYPDTRINYDAERITRNNPGLKPQDAANFDVSIERYFEPVGIISAGVFLKEIKNFLFSTVVRIPTGDDNGFDGEYAGWELATQTNGGFGRVRGAELNYSQQLSFLPGFWSGLGIFGNYTWLETTGNYGRVNEAPSSALVNFTPRVASAGLSYSRGRFYARINGNYTSSYLRAYNIDPLARSYRTPRTMIDAKMGFRYSRGLTLFTDVANIFNSKHKQYSGEYAERITDQRDHGVRFQAGVNGSF